MNIIKNLKWYFNKQLFPSSKKCKHWTVYRIPNGEPTTIFANITDLTDVRVPQQTVTFIAPDVTVLSGYDDMCDDLTIEMVEYDKIMLNGFDFCIEKQTPIDGDALEALNDAIAKSGKSKTKRHFKIKSLWKKN